MEEGPGGWPERWVGSGGTATMASRHPQARRGLGGRQGDHAASLLCRHRVAGRVREEGEPRRPAPRHRRAPPPQPHTHSAGSVSSASCAMPPPPPPPYPLPGRICVRVWSLPVAPCRLRAPWLPSQVLRAACWRQGGGTTLLSQFLPLSDLNPSRYWKSSGLPPGLREPDSTCLSGSCRRPPRSWPAARAPHRPLVQAASGPHRHPSPSTLCSVTCPPPCRPHWPACRAGCPTPPSPAPCSGPTVVCLLAQPCPGPGDSGHPPAALSHRVHSPHAPLVSGAVGGPLSTQTWPGHVGVLEPRPLPHPRGGVP